MRDELLLQNNNDSKQLVFIVAGDLLEELFYVNVYFIFLSSS